MQNHVVQAGETVISLHEFYGVPVEKIWNHPDNLPLRNRGRSPEVLFPGDMLAIPEREVAGVEAATGKRHKYVLRAQPVLLKLRLLKEGRPRANEPYRLQIDGRECASGSLNERSEIEVPIAAGARRGEIRLGTNGQEEVVKFRIGQLAPVTETLGVQQRLNNLGFWCGAEDGILGPLTRGALLAFQRGHGLRPAREADRATRDKLVEEHGS